MIKLVFFSILILLMTVKAFPNDKVKKSKLCELWKSVVLDDKLKNATSGVNSTENGIKYSENATFSNNKERRWCPCINNPCIRKCCRKNEIYIRKINGRVECGSNSYGINVTEEVINNEIMSNFSIKNAVVVYNELQYDCDKRSMFFADEEYVVISNGSLLYKNDNHVVTIDDYCFDYVRAGSQERLIKNGTYFFMCTAPLKESIERPKLRARKSNDEEKLLIDYQNSLQLKYYPIFMIISLPFLMITFVVYTFVSELNNLVGKCLASMAISVAIEYNLFPPVMWKGPDGLGKTCKYIAYLLEFAVLSSFCWLNVMCFDIWAVFSGYAQPHRSLSKNHEIKKYVKYAIYAWGTPLILCLSIYMVDERVGLEEKSKIKPNMGSKYCLLDNNYSKVIFYYFPLTIILILNITFFSITLYKILKHQSQSNILKTHGNRVNRVEKERLNLYLKLFLVMGIPWIGEPLSRVFDNVNLFWLWFVVDSINLLQGIPIFIIFVCKRRTMRVLNSKLHPSIRYFSSVRTSRSSRRESSSRSSRRESNVDSTDAVESTVC